MPQQLIYTSAPRGLVAGRSGHCTVARSAAMREALALQLEKLSYYQHLSLSGGHEHPIHACRIVDIRGTRYHVLSRIQDAGLDFTGRTNFLAHHLIFMPEEIRQSPSPPLILRGWTGWVKSWTVEPQLLEREDWSLLAGLAANGCVPAMTWKQVTGDGANAYGLLEVRAGMAFRVDDLAEERILSLFAESLELLELRDPRHDFRATCWQYTFTTSMQEQDNPADFRWRCLHSDNLASNRFVGPDCRPLSAVRATNLTGEEKVLATSGRQPPRFVIQPQRARAIEGEPVRLRAKAEGVPFPTYEWFSVDRANNPHPIPNGSDAELVVQNPPLGISRYVVRASNSLGEATSDVATLSVESKVRLSQPRPVSESRPVFSRTSGHLKTAEQIEADRERHQARQAQARIEGRSRRNKVLVALLAILLIVAAGMFTWRELSPKRVKEKPALVSQEQNLRNENTPIASSPLGDPASSLLKSNSVRDSASPSTESKPASSELKIGQNQAGSLPPPTEPDWPPEWMRLPIGTVSYFHADCITNASSVFHLSIGSEGFRTNGDALFFVCKTNAGTEFQASLFVRPSDPSLPSNSMRGIMIRSSTDPVSPFVFIGASSQKILAYRRDARGVISTRELAILKGADNAPVILRFQQRPDNQVVPGYSWNNQDWTSVQDYSFSESTQSLVGFTACSGISSNRIVAHFVNLSPKPATNLQR